MAKKKRRFRLTKRRVLVLAGVIYISVIFLNQRSLMKTLNAKKDAYNKDINQLEAEIAKLEGIIDNSSSLEFIEKVARDDLGMVKPREIIFVDKNKKKNNPFSPLKDDN